MKKFFYMRNLIGFESIILTIIWFLIISGINVNIDHLNIKVTNNNILYTIRAYSQIFIFIFLIYKNLKIPNFYSNRNKASFIPQLQEIFKDEFNLIRIKYNSKINITRAWSVTYDKGHYHVPHNHSSQGYAAIMYLQMKKDSPKTTYIQPWNNEKDKSVLYTPDVKEGDIMIVPQFVTHYTEPNKIYFKKRILSFDFNIQNGEEMSSKGKW